MEIELNIQAKHMVFVIVVATAIVGIGDVLAAGGTHPSGEIIVEPGGFSRTVCEAITGHPCGYDTDTNANTACSGTYTYLSGDGQCRDVRSDGDLYDTDTRCSSSGTCSQVCIGTSCRSSWPSMA